MHLQSKIAMECFSKVISLWQLDWISVFEWSTNLEIWLFMDKIVDHLFVFRGEGEIEDFPGNYSDFRAYEDSADVAQKEDNKIEKKDWKQQNNTTGLSFNEQKEFQKIERDIKDLEYEKKQIEQLFSDGKVADDMIEKKAIELQNIIAKIEEKEERWFELSAKIEG